MSAPRPGRRAAVADSRRPDRGVVLAVVLVALAAVLVLVAGRGADTGPTAQAPSGVLVDHAVHGCPGYAGQPDSRTRAAIGAAPVQALGDSGRIRYGAPAAAPSTAADLARGELLRLRAGADAPQTLAVRAEGELAAGLFTFRADTGRDGTLAVARCPSPRSRWWFTGAGGTLDHASTLVLSNLDPGPAVVDVRVLGTGGEVDTLGTRGITVPPFESTTLELTEIAPQGEELAVSVVASRGRVVAGVVDAFAPEIGAAQGVDWIPPQARASRVLRLAGIPGRAGSHTLLVGNPTEREALVDVRLSGRSGAFTPTGAAAQVRVPPESVVSADLGEAVGRNAAAVLLRSPVPVTATVRTVDGDDIGYAAVVRALDGPAVAPLPPGTDATVMVTAGQRAGSVTVTGFAEDGTPVQTATLDAPAGATTTWSPRRRTAYLVLRPEDGGDVFGAVGYATDGGVSQVGLQPLLVRVDRPVVRPGVR